MIGSVKVAPSGVTQSFPFQEPETQPHELIVTVTEVSFRFEPVLKVIAS